MLNYQRVKSTTTDFKGAFPAMQCNKNPSTWQPSPSNSELRGYFVRAGCEPRPARKMGWLWSWLQPPKVGEQPTKSVENGDWLVVLTILKNISQWEGL